MANDTVKIIWDVSSPVQGLQTMLSEIGNVSKALDSLNGKATTFADNFEAAIKDTRGELALLIKELQEAEKLMSNLSHYTAQQGGWTQGQSNNPGGGGYGARKPWGFSGGDTYPPAYSPAQGPGGQEYGLSSGGFGYNQGLAMLQGIQPMNMVGGFNDPQSADRRAAMLNGAIDDERTAEKVAGAEKRAFGFMSQAAKDAMAAEAEAAKLRALRSSENMSPKEYEAWRGKIIEAESDRVRYAAQDTARVSYGQTAYGDFTGLRSQPVGQTMADQIREQIEISNLRQVAQESLRSAQPYYDAQDRARAGYNQTAYGDFSGLRPAAGGTQFDLMREGMAQGDFRRQYDEQQQAAYQNQMAQAQMAAAYENEQRRLRAPAEYEARSAQSIRDDAARLRYAQQDQARVSYGQTAYGDFSGLRSQPAGPTEYDLLREQLEISNLRQAAQADLRARMPVYNAQDQARAAYNQTAYGDFSGLRAGGETTYDQMRAQMAAGNAARAAAPINLSGLTGPAYGYGLAQNLAQAQAQQQAAFQSYSQAQQVGQGVPEAATKMNAASTAVQQLKAQQDALRDSTDKGANSQRNFADQLRTQASYAVGAILIYGGMRKAMEELNMAIQGGMQIQRTQIEAQFISGQTPGQTNAAFIEAARYGIGPSAAAGGISAAARTGASAAQQEFARQATLMFGADQYHNIIQETQQTERRSESVGQPFDLGNFKNFLATAYKTVDIDNPLENYSDAYQLGTELMSTLKASADQAGLLILNITKATEQSPQIVSTMLERVRLAIDPDTAAGKKHIKDLASMGITGTDTPDLLRAVAREVAGASKVGNTDRANDILSSLVGGLQGPTTLLQLRQIFTELDASLNGAQQPLADFTKLIDGLNSSTQKATAEFSATWELFLSNMAAALIKSPLGQYLQGQLSAASTGMQAVVETQDAQKYFAGLSFSEQQALVSRFAASNPDNPAGHLANGQLFPKDLIQALGGASSHGLASFTSNDVFGEAMRATTMGGSSAMSQADTLKLLQYIAAHMNDNANSADSARWNGIAGTYATGTGQTGVTNGNLPRSSLPSYDFGGFQDLPKGVDFNQLTKDIKFYEQKLTAEVPDYEQNPKEVAFWDATLKEWRIAHGDDQAIRMAVQGQLDLMKQVSGLFNVPVSGEVLIPFAALEAGYGPDYGGGSSTSSSGGGTSAKGGSRGTKGGLRKRTQGEDDDIGLMEYRNGQGSNYRAKAKAGANGRWAQDPDADVGLMDPSHDPNRTSSGKMVNEMHDMYKNANGILQQLAVAVNITLNNRVTISGKTIVDTQTNEMANALGTVRRGGGGAGAQALAN